MKPPPPLGPGGGQPADGVRAVYVHAPFCARRCFYCDFAVTVSSGERVDEWLEAIEGEWVGLADDEIFQPLAPLETLYVGGGTPSLLGPSAMAGLARVLGDPALANDELEWTAEANPESFTPEVARAWRRAGTNRVSLGVQSFQERPLRWMGRLHGPEGARRAVDSARRAGFEEISVDLIFALPGHLERSWEQDLDAVLSLGVPHVSLYGLTVESATPLGRAVREGREAPPDADAYSDEYLTAARRLTAEGYVHYEVSNFALPGRESRHNQVYWDGRPYVGLGNGAHSYSSPVRRWNPRDWDAYRRRVADGGPAEESREVLDPGQARLEAVWLGLRTWRGLGLDTLPEEAARLAREWVTRGLAEARDGVVRLTAEGWLDLDGLAVELDDALPPARDRSP